MIQILISFMLVFGVLSGDFAMAAPALSLRQKIGQMLMVGFHGKKSTEEWPQKLRQQVEAGDVGGVIFFAYNIDSPKQIKELTAFFKRTRAPLPVLMAIDQEGGKVQRLKSQNGFPDFLSARDVAKTMTPDQAETYYSQMSAVIKDAGFNFNFGPVVDLHTHPKDGSQAVSPAIGKFERSYSPKPETVAAYAGAFVRAHRRLGVLTSLKHYPGHGLTKDDSHQGMVDITQTHDAVERAPFRVLIESGEADAVMAAHLIYRPLDQEIPVSLSSVILPKWLRKEDGFKGVAITDDLVMGAVKQNFSLQEAVIRAIKAGNDILILSNNDYSKKKVTEYTPDPNLASRVIAIVEDALKEGRLGADRIEEAFQRITTLKARL